MHTFLFDIDGTLLSTQSAGTHTIDRVLHDVFQIKRKMPLRLHGRTDRAILNELLAFHDIPADDQSFEAFQEAYLPLLDEFLKQRPSTILPGVLELLDWLAGQEDVALGILTGNMRGGAEIKLKHSQLAPRFCFGGYGDIHPERDDVARSAVQAARTHLGKKFREDHVWVIGDTPADITCARAVGARVVGVLTGGGDHSTMSAHQPEHLLPDLQSAIPIFQEILDAEPLN